MFYYSNYKSGLPGSEKNIEKNFFIFSRPKKLLPCGSLYTKGNGNFPETVFVIWLENSKPRTAVIG